jgi:translation initiation factor IF-2
VSRIASNADTEEPGLARKIYEVAKELGIKSKVVIDRCEAEGIPNIKSHMTVVSAGLEETIKGWFAGAEQQEDEDSASTDVKLSAAQAGSATGTLTQTVAKPRARAVARKKKTVAKTTEETPQTAINRAIEETRKVAKAGASQDAESSDAVIRRTLEEAGVLEEHDRREAQEAADAAAAAAAAVAAQEAAAAPIAPEQEFAPPPSSQPTAPATAQQAAASAPVETPQPQVSQSRERAPSLAMPFTPVRPDSVTPAGQKLEHVHTKAKLSGPKVVRIEPAEAV